MCDSEQQFEDILEEMESCLIHLESSIFLKERENSQQNLTRRRSYLEKIKPVISTLRQFTDVSSLYLLQQAGFFMDEIILQIDPLADDLQLQESIDLLFRATEGIRFLSRQEHQNIELQKELILFGGLDHALLEEMYQIIINAKGFSEQITPSQIDIFTSDKLLLLLKENSVGEKLALHLSQEGWQVQKITTANSLGAAIKKHSPFVVIAQDIQLAKVWNGFKQNSHQYQGAFLLVKCGENIFSTGKELSGHISTEVDILSDQEVFIQQVYQLRAKINRKLLTRQA